MPPLTRSGRLSGAAPGRVLAAAVLLGSGGAGLAYTGDPQRVWDTVGQAGFTLRQIELEGQEQTSDSAIIAAVGLGPGATLLGLDVDAARVRLEALPWVRSATVRKALPGTLMVEIEEAEAFARWRYRGEEVLIAKDGAVLADTVPFAFRDLPLVAGPDANEAAQNVIGLLAEVPLVEARTVAAAFIGARRWDLHLENGALVRLPAEEAGTALAHLTELEARGGLMEVENIVIDLRVPGRASVQLRGGEAEVDDDGEEALPQVSSPADPLAAAIAEANAVYSDPLAKAIAEALIP